MRDSLSGQMLIGGGVQMLIGGGVINSGFITTCGRLLNIVINTIQRLLNTTPSSEDSSSDSEPARALTAMLYKHRTQKHSI